MSKFTLPCSVGDMVYVDIGCKFPAVRKIVEINITDKSVIFTMRNKRTEVDSYCTLDDFGKTVFINKQESMIKGLADLKHIPNPFKELAGIF